MFPLPLPSFHEGPEGRDFLVWEWTLLASMSTPQIGGYFWVSYTLIFHLTLIVRDTVKEPCFWPIAELACSKGLSPPPRIYKKNGCAIYLKGHKGHHFVCLLKRSTSPPPPDLSAG